MSYASQTVSRNHNAHLSAMALVGLTVVAANDTEGERLRRDAAEWVCQYLRDGARPHYRSGPRRAPQWVRAALTTAEISALRGIPSGPARLG